MAAAQIYLSDDLSAKANIKVPKKALGAYKGCAIWLGSEADTLVIVEGPEDGLSVREAGCSFVACTIAAGNMTNLTIPAGVERVILFRDNDEAGEKAARTAAANTRSKIQKQETGFSYGKQGKSEKTGKNGRTKAVAYLRTSSAANVGQDKDSDKRQRAAIAAFAKRAKYEIAAEDWFYDPAVSGADPIETRPGFNRLLDRIENNGVRTVIVEDAAASLAIR